MSSNPLLQNIRIPGETVRLPSMGLFYEADELYSNDNGEVHVHPMSAIDEIVMRNVDKLINGESITEVFKRCIPNIAKPEELYAKDVDTLLLLLRKVTYGNDIEATYTHDCENAKIHTYTADLGKFITSARSIDPTQIVQNYQLRMDSGQIVHIRPIRFKDIIKLMQDTSINPEASMAELQQRMVESTINVIHAVDAITDRDQIREWAQTIPVMWFRQISRAIDASSEWGPSTILNTVCQDCKKEITIDIPLNPLTFFL